MGKRTVEILRREKMEMTLPTLVELFAATKQAEGKSPKTVTWYRLMIGRFIQFLGDTATIRDLSLKNARAFVAHLQGQKTRYQDHPLIPVQEGGLSVHTIHGYVRAIKAFGSWLAEEGFTAVNKFVRLKRPKLPQTMVETLTDGEIALIFKIINPKCFLGARMELICLLLLDTGVRASELTGLTVNRTFVRENYLKVIGKGGKERMVPFGNTTKKALLRYLVTWRPEPVDDDMLILSVKGKPLTQNALSHLSSAWASVRVCRDCTPICSDTLSP
jgi:site-specific recombinase XerD